MQGAQILRLTLQDACIRIDRQRQIRGPINCAATILIFDVSLRLAVESMAQHPDSHAIYFTTSLALIFVFVLLKKLPYSKISYRGLPDIIKISLLHSPQSSDTLI